jgi:hypothetical protein
LLLDAQHDGNEHGDIVKVVIHPRVSLIIIRSHVPKFIVDYYHRNNNASTVSTCMKMKYYDVDMLVPSVQ